ncbi:MAG: agmatine deiminase family protein [Geminicoccaceae bacterium]
MSNPRDEGFRLAPDWAPHARCWMAWPCHEARWGDRLDGARRAFAEVADAIAGFEPVTVIARPDLTATVSLYTGSGVSVLPLPQDDAWLRDTGPAFLQGEPGLAGVVWRFNGWGERWPDHAQDERLAERLLQHFAIRSFVSRLVVEGGNLVGDGEGTAILCEPAVLDPRRNPGLARAEVEAELGRLLGVDRVIWLPYALEDDETGGRAENLVAFVRPGTVLALHGEDAADPDQPGLAANLAVLRDAEDARGRRLEVVTVAPPKPRKRHDGRRLTMSYTSFYLANGGVVMPGYADAADKAAWRTVSQLFPGRTTLQVEVDDLAEGGGGIRSLALGQPAA